MHASFGRACVPEVIFLVEQTPAGSFTARALGESIFTEANDMADLREQVRDAVHCYFNATQAPPLIRLRFVHEDGIRA